MQGEEDTGAQTGQDKCQDAVSGCAGWSCEHADEHGFCEQCGEAGQEDEEEAGVEESTKEPSVRKKLAYSRLNIRIIDMIV